MVEKTKIERIVEAQSIAAEVVVGLNQAVAALDRIASMLPQGSRVYTRIAANSRDLQKVKRDMLHMGPELAAAVE